jgi:molybdopterin-guanine dinucleotide biosynthesis protein A
MKRLPVYILAGGRSSRFGSDKARAVVRGQPLIAHVAMMLEPVAVNITVVADYAGKYDDLGFRTIADRQPGLGPLAGLDTALHDLPIGNDWLLLCSCDALVIRRDWLSRLVNAITDDGDAVAFQADRRQPMPALYARTAASAVAQQMKRDQRSMQALLNQLRVTNLPLPDDWPKQWQANQPSDLIAFLADQYAITDSVDRLGANQSVTPVHRPTLQVAFESGPRSRGRRPRRTGGKDGAGPRRA